MDRSPLSDLQGITLQVASGPQRPTSSTPAVGLYPGQVHRYDLRGEGRAALPTPDSIIGSGQRLSIALYPALGFSGPADDAVPQYCSLLVGIEAVTADGQRHRLVDQHQQPFTADELGVWVTDQWNLVHLDLSAFEGQRLGFEVTSSATSTGHGWLQVLGVHDTPPVDADPIELVRTTRGTHSNSGSSLSRGNTFPMTCVPHGFNFLTPVTDARTARWLYAWHGDARDLDPRPCVQAFSFCHQPSPWIADRFAFQVMPWVCAAGETPSADVCARQQRFDHADEHDRPHLYRVRLDSGITAEMTATSHAGVFRFGFGTDTVEPASARLSATPRTDAQVPADSPRGIILDQPFNGSLDVTTLPDGRLSFTASVEATPEWLRGGYVALQGYVYGETRQPATAMREPVTREGIPDLPGNIGRWISRHWPRWARVPSHRDQTWILTSSDNSDTLEVAIAMSFISTTQAKQNLALEVGDQSFDEVAAAAREQWQQVLGSLEIDGGTHDQRTAAWSNLARLYAWPNEHHENLGSADEPRWGYASPWQEARTSHTTHHTGAAIVDGLLHVNNGYWDTYRTCWPAYHLFTPKKSRALLEGQVQQFRDGGWMARWCAPGALDCMVGTSSDQVFADAAAHGLRFDELTAYDSALRNASCPADRHVVGRKGIDRGRFIGYIDTSTSEGFSWSMENATCDAALARWSSDLADRADELGAPHRRAEFSANAAWFRLRGLSWQTLFDERIGFFQGRDTDGEFRVAPDEFDPRVWGHDYTETNAWGMAFHVPQDGAGLAAIYGGEAALAAKLEEAIATAEHASAANAGGYPVTMHERTEARALRLGQIGMSNQPAHHTPYMFTFTGQHHRTQWLTREILQRLFVGSDIGQGYPGDEDNGEMSAWWLFSAMGLYPLHLGTGELVITSPLFERMAIRRDNGRLLEVTATATEGSIADCRYIQSMTVNGDVWDRITLPLCFLEEDLTLDFVLGPEPSRWAADSRPFSLSTWQGSDGPLWTSWHADLTSSAVVDRINADGDRAGTGLVDDRGDIERWNKSEQLLMQWQEPVTPGLLTLTTEDLDVPELMVDVIGADGADDDWQPLHVGWRAAQWANQTQAYLVEEIPIRALRISVHSDVRLRQVELY